MNINKLRPCKVGEELYLFHGFTQISQIVPPSLMRGGHGGGVVAGAYAVLERRDGTVGLAEAQRVQFSTRQRSLPNTKRRRQKMFDYTREHENDFSFWYPKIKDCGIPTPLTFYTKLPSAEEEPEYVKRLYEAFYMEHPNEDEETVKAYLEERVIPKLKEMGLTGHVFVKNGRFSNKFNANGTCNLYGLHELYRAHHPNQLRGDMLRSRGRRRNCGAKVHRKPCG